MRDKENFSVHKDFLSELLGFDLTIENWLESESNKQNEDDKIAYKRFIENRRNEASTLDTAKENAEEMPKLRLQKKCWQLMQLLIL